MENINIPIISSKPIKQTNKENKTDSYTIDELHKYYNDFMNEYKSKLFFITKLVIFSIIEQTLTLEEAKDRSKIEANLLEINNLTTKLRSEFNNTSMYLVSHDVQSYLKYFEDINKEVTNIKEKLNPKKKFKFSNRKNEINQSQKQENNENTDNKPIVNETKTDLIYSKEDLVITNVNSTTIIVNESLVIGKFNLLIESIKDSRIIIPFNFKSLFAKNIQNSTIVVGGVSGGSHLTDVNNSSIYLSTHQLRIHQSNNTNFVVLVNSKPIIEHCNQVRFSDILSYLDDQCKSKILELIKQAELNAEVNMYSEVQDFQWLKSEKSPNFEVITNTEKLNLLN